VNPAIWLQRTGRVASDAPALYRGTHLIATYGELAARVAGMAGAFRDKFGINPGDRVVIFMPNCTEYLEVMYAAWHAGAAVVPINAMPVR